MYQKTVLPNGLRVLTERLENTQAVTVLILVGAGSRYETPEINGLSHFLEHMFFKGAKKYKNTKEVSEAIDGVGGEFNAFTGKEYVGYYVKVAVQEVMTALDVLSDMLLESRFDAEEIERERGVIMEEYNMYQDTPSQQIGWDFERLVYGDQPMGWDQVGTKEVIHSLRRDDFVKYQQQLYTSDNIVVAIAGNVEHEHMVKEVERLFSIFQKSKAYVADPVRHMERDDFVAVRNKKTEQAHVMLGFPGYEERHLDHYALKLLTIVLGGNMSSRMFLSVRERQGLAYYISTSSDDYSDTGIVSTNAGVTVDKIDDALQSILGEYAKIREEKVTAAELEKAKAYVKGKLILRLEDCEEYAHLLGKREVLYGEVMTMKRIFESIDKVTPEDLQRVAQDLLLKDRLYLAVIGPYDDKSRFEKLLQSSNHLP